MNAIEEHIRKTISKGSRLDGRKLDEIRNIVIEKNLVKTAEGSARVKFGDSEVISGVKLSIGAPFPDTPDQGALMVNVELIPMANPEFESGPPGIESIEISRQVDKVIRESHVIDMKKLCIEEGEKVWIVSIDIIPINANGNLIDVSCLASLAALQNTFYPLVEDGRVNYKEKTKENLQLENTPLAITIGKIEDSFIVDLDHEEGKAIDARITFGILEDDTICSIQKGENSTLTIDDVSRMLDLAIEKAREMRSKL